MWRVSIEHIPDEGGTGKRCRMRNTPLSLFICPQTASCELECTQKDDQAADQDYVFRQRLKMQMLVQRRMQGSGDARRD